MVVLNSHRNRVVVRVLYLSRDWREDYGLPSRKRRAITLWDKARRFNDARNHFVTHSSNNYKFLSFLQISFYIPSCHILLISIIYSISTLSSLPSIIPVIPSSLSRYLLSTQRYASRRATPRHRWWKAWMASRTFHLDICREPQVRV